MLHWAAGAGGRGALLAGDIVQVIPDRNYVSFMRSYPNMVPLSAPAVARIGAMLEPFPFEVIHGAWFDRSVVHNGKDAVKRSIARYIAAIQGDGTAELNDRSHWSAPLRLQLRLIPFRPMTLSPPDDPLPTSARVFLDGMRNSATSAFSLVLIGTYVGVGALGHDYGFSLPWVMLSTVLIWAGPAQVILISALGTGAAAIEVASRSG